MGQGLCEWGLRGVEALRDRVAALVIVDVLSFSTAVDVALASGALVIPFSLSDRATARVAAAAAGAVLAKHPGRPAARGLQLVSAEPCGHPTWYEALTAVAKRFAAVVGGWCGAGLHRVPAQR